MRCVYALRMGDCTRQKHGSLVTNVCWVIAKYPINETVAMPTLTKRITATVVWKPVWCVENCRHVPYNIRDSQSSGIFISIAT